MYKLIRFYNQNRKKIWTTILIVALILAVIQLLDYMARNKSNTSNKNNTEIASNVNTKQELVSNKSAVTGQNVSSSKLQKETDIIDEFFKYCNEGDINSAYEMLTEECKEAIFSSIEDFNNIYYSNLFNGEKKTYTLENWSGNTYQVRITENILATGKLNNSETKQDYITVVEKNDEYKLNINNYVGRTEKNKITENEQISVNIQSIDTYMDYEIYNISVENRTDNVILLGTTDDTKSVYLLDSKDMKYYFYSNEVAENRLIVQPGFKNNLKIKFSNTYSSSRKITDLVFSKVVLNYREYMNLEDKTEYTDFYQFIANV